MPTVNTLWPGSGACRAALAVTEAEIPSTASVHALARACAERSGVWWRELEILLVAYSGMRWGEHVALTADRVDIERRRITVDRQVVETRSALKLTLPKGRRRRMTMFPARTPGDVDLAALVERRLAEINPDGLVFPAPRGGWARRSNYGCNTWDPTAITIGWPQRDDGRWAWTFQSLRHVFATWALVQLGLRLEDVSRLLGHSGTRVTQDVYVHVHDDVYRRSTRRRGSWTTRKPMRWACLHPPAPGHEASGLNHAEVGSHVIVIRGFRA
jgi:integrase